VYGNLAATALRTGSESEYMIYLFARRMVSSPGASSVRQMDLVREVQRLGVFRSGAHARELLQRGHGRYWNLGGDRLWLRSPLKIARSMGVCRSNAHRQLVPVEKLTTRASRRAELFAAALPIDTPITQHALRTETGVCERTQRRYRHRGHFRAIRNDADLTTAAVGLATPAMRRWWARGNSHHGIYVQGPEARLMKRLPNSYSVQAPRIRRGRRSRDMFKAQALYAIAEGMRTALRVFFDTGRQWVRCRRLKLGTDEGEAYGYPFNLAYVRTGQQSWEAIAC
jgi:hypothetical protein